MSNESQEPQPAAAATPAKKGGLTCAAALVLIVGILALFAFLLVNKVIELPGAAADKTFELAGRTRDALKETFQITPKIVNRNTVVFEQNQPIMELALLSRETNVRDEFEHSFLGSTKKVRLEGTYVVKAGFDLGEPFSAFIDARVVTLLMPPARILSVEQKNVEVLEFSNGIWNKIRPDELQDRINLLAGLARQRLLQQGINAEAERSLIDRLQERLGPDVIIRVNPPIETNPAELPFPKG